jgi:hypothetical protein
VPTMLLGGQPASSSGAADQQQQLQCRDIALPVGDLAMTGIGARRRGDDRTCSGVTVTVMATVVVVVVLRLGVCAALGQSGEGPRKQREGTGGGGPNQTEADGPTNQPRAGRTKKRRDGTGCKQGKDKTAFSMLSKKSPSKQAKRSDVARAQRAGQNDSQVVCVRVELESWWPSRKRSTCVTFPDTCSKRAERPGN